MPEFYKTKLKLMPLPGSYRTLLAFSFALSAFVPFILFGIVAVSLLTAELKSDAGARNLMLARSCAFWRSRPPFLIEVGHPF